LSVIGSVAYELIVAGIAAAEMGLEGISSDFTAEVFTVAVWTMSLGAAIGLLIIAFLTPHIDKLKAKVTGGDQQWMQILSAATFFGAVSYMAAQPLVKGGSGLVAFLGGFVSVALIGIVITVGRQNWLKEWALSLSIVLGMVSAGVGFHFFGIGG
ncbi:MAG: DUF5058 family protein, partial [Proteobacteria bacterium]|nr:DUF5058 family protein [Pseudomonadota bacterium]